MSNEEIKKRAREYSIKSKIEKIIEGARERINNFQVKNTGSNDGLQADLRELDELSFKLKKKGGVNE